ncbi:hypothetical protein AB6D37_01780 [Pectobacterium brasiliense]|uniref:hypothetical protein n=1 Tax=Pectobacterium brasiliense TaxID=180957 RepID=UPI0039879AF7
MINQKLSSDRKNDAYYPVSSISNLKARNIIRGILNNDSKGDVLRALEKIKESCNNKEYKECVNVVRGNELFKANNYSRYFVDKCMLIHGEEELGTFDEIRLNIEKNFDRLNDIFMLYGSLYKNISLNKIEKAIENLNEIIDAQGLSILLIRIIHFLRNKLSQSDDAGTEQNFKLTLDEILSRIQISRVKHLENAIKWISLSKDNYFNLYGKIKENKNDKYINLMVRNFLEPFPESEVIYIKTLNAYYSFSLIDAVIYIFNSERIQLPFAEVFRFVFKELRDQYNVFSKSYPVIKVNEPSYDEYVDQFFYRESFLLGELEWVFKYRLIHDAFYRKDESGYFLRPPIQKKYLNEYFYGLNDFMGLRISSDGGYLINFERYNSKTSGQLENTTALIYILEKLEGDISGSDDVFIKLMTYTHDIGEICPERILTKILTTSKNSDVALIISCLMFIKYKTRKAEHVLRANLQEVIVERFESDIIKMVRHFYKISPAVTEHLINLCDENFLSMMFDLTERPIDAINNRANILEWFGETTKDVHYVERSKNLRTDIKISKEKGTIDDSRIYVDTTKYIQWINDNKINKFTNLLEMLNISNSLEISNVKVNWVKAKSGLTVVDSIASEILNYYEEFCTNKLFGVSSYLGRRIRHGTFKGTGLKDITDIQNSSMYTNLKTNKIFNEHYSAWIKNYTQMLDELKNGYLHIFSKSKPNGFIKTDLTTKSKIIIADHLLKDILSSYFKDTSGAHLPFIIVEYCWRFIEEDLSEIRKLLMEYKSKYGVFNIIGHNFKGALKREYQEFTSNINSISAEKFRTISSWFNKPSIVSPTTDIVLLFKAVVSEVKGLQSGFEPVVSVCDEKYEISGGKYFAIYDALYLIIHNAARHGKPDGNLNLKIEFNRSSKALKLSVMSEFKSQIDGAQRKVEIERKFIENNEDANDIDENSGLKKLTRMEDDSLIKNLDYEFNDLNITISFDFVMDY